jgi:DtxR family Mn-dependent transcriptional regulator
LTHPKKYTKIRATLKLNRECILSERTVEEYLESIGTLEERKVPIRTADLAQILGVTSASVSEMLQRLSEKGLVKYAPYKGASLTEEGRRLVLSLMRRHRLWEVFLNQHLGIGWEDIYQEACNLEHVTSALVTEKLAQFLNNPEICPHGRPIPKNERRMPRMPGVPLSNIEDGTEIRVVGVMNERDAALLRYLTDIGLTVGVKVQVLEKAPFDGTLTIRVNDSIRAVGPEAANLIMVEQI